MSNARSTEIHTVDSVLLPRSTLFKLQETAN